MNNLKKISLKDILEITGVIMREKDLMFFCHDVEVIKEFSELCKKEKLNQEKVQKFLIRHEDKIDKEKFLLLMIKNYQESIQTVTEKIEDNNNRITRSISIKSSELLEDLANENVDLSMERYVQEEILKKAKKLGQGMEKCITMRFYNQEENKYDIKVIDSNEIINGIYSKGSKKLKRFQELDEEFKEDDNKEDEEPDEIIGIECILQSIVLTDYREIFEDEDFGENIRSLILDNAILKHELLSNEEIESCKASDYEKYIKIIDKTIFEGLLPDIKNTLEKYIKYVNIDKMLAISAYRFEEGLENDFIDSQKSEIVKEILEIILKNMKEDKKIYTFTIQEKKDKSYDWKKVQYSSKDIKQCINRLSKDSYLKKKDIEERREEIYLQEKNLLQLNPEHIDIIFSEKELEKIAILNEANMIYVSEKLKWENGRILETIKAKRSCSTELLSYLIKEDKISDKDILELYMNKIITLDQITEIKNIIDLANEINAHDLNQLYKKSMLNEVDTRNKDSYSKYLGIYKELLFKDTTIEQNELYADELMEELIGDYDPENLEDHIKAIENYYKEGILTLNVILQWNDEKVIKEVISNLYDNEIITLDEIKQLVKSRKLPFEYVEEMIWKENISYEARKKIISEGWIPEEEIFNLFSKALIRKEDLKSLAERSIISPKRVKEFLNNISVEDLEKNSAIVLNIGEGLQKIKRNESIYGTSNEYKVEGKKRPRFIIDPNEREAFFELLGAYIPEKIKINKESPFYNYEFYVIPDETGKINLNSVVIAERIYEEREQSYEERDKGNDGINLGKNKQQKKLRFALDNATYFFKYSDLMVLSNYLKKDEVVKEKENIVFRANHTLATDEKDGHWAISVIYALVKTMLSSDLKEYSKENQRRIIIEALSRSYSYDKIMEILDRAQKIDSGEYIYEIIDDDAR